MVIEQLEHVLLGHWYNWLYKVTNKMKYKSDVQIVSAFVARTVAEEFQAGIKKIIFLKKTFSNFQYYIDLACGS